MKLQKSGENSFHIQVPLNMVKAKEWSKGQELDWFIDMKGNLVLK